MILMQKLDEIIHYSIRILNLLLQKEHLILAQFIYTEILLVDQKDFCGCGISEGEFISLGYFEREDTLKVIEHIENQDKKISEFGIWGRSMGAATSLMLKKKAGFDLEKCNPLEVIKKLKQNDSLPKIMFLAAIDDVLIKPEHSQKLFDAFRGSKRIIIFEGNHNSRRSQEINQEFQFYIIQGQFTGCGKMIMETYKEIIEGTTKMRDIPKIKIEVKNFNTASEFCPQCGYLIEMPIYSDKVECNKCEFICSVLEYKCPPIISKIQFSHKKPWLEQYNAKIRGVDDKEQNFNQKKAKIKSECPQCGYHTMYFWTVQTRSADEGSTVFYECADCKHTYTQNN
ncbi:RNA polymerase i subunit, putative [Ichthyophthirius multifiliis]|uniref:RNA polymerase i subunit, putative n=1 Tax=Ichthyophthirius multifiliis TaxID=5932 RepID=G0QMJ9_ICHMU|nr:RNA polymerase i subunit, putative [Ichthyophthirius multifiliis]EGR33565.1 RNA polymerase i subunit, putative [Ichthyophthirius multifiliis]|eukprot:XP_004037551.1 RNA polymerase i subunit, putative [Ichthyophthirius multifiliis]